LFFLALSLIRYSAAKHALQGYFDSLRAEVVDRNVRVTTVLPGYVSTNLSLNAVTGDGTAYGRMDETTLKVNISCVHVSVTCCIL
jgi:dehydrogenase/reductase SDR family member 7B